MINRIFGIGLSRTGTTSLTHALLHVGIDAIHYPSKKQIFDPNVKAISDISVVPYFKELDAKFPNSKFIYTTRDKESWLVSIEKHFDKHKSSRLKAWFKENRIKVYGGLDFDKDLYSRAFDDHDKNVREYFEDRDDLLILEVHDTNKWDKILSFLELTNKETTIEFPHKRKTQKD